MSVTEPIKQGCDYVEGYDWNVRVAYAICMAESRGNVRANNAGLNRNGTVDYGLMQINSIHADMVGGELEKLYDPEVNVGVAYKLYKARGDFTAWSAYNNKSYLMYM